MRRLLIIFLILLPALAFGQGKPMLGEQIDKTHQLGDPVGAWFFLERSGNKVFDLSGGNTGTFGGTPTWESGQSGSAIRFVEADSDYISFGNESFFDSTTLTIVAWIYFIETPAEAYKTICSKRDGGDFAFQFGIGVAGNLTNITFLPADGGRLTGSDFPENQWAMASATIGSGTLSLYINGILDVSAAGRTIIPNNVDFQIGRQFGNDNHFNGLMSSIMIFNRALSASEIALLYREPFCMFEKDNIALMAKAAEAPPTVVPTLYYYSRFTPIPLAIIAFCFILGRKNE